ncbi:hypothetical protein FIBSPDRAFT_875439 [Athelia psychrophila]|uniref:Uncharacterized protein n=1 Tax=Athelia psychrophila TaxID=1759441 RepID=A0A167XPI7_9AGAM|nr:hypothetical protein FIBSPDRAFT_875439 [Fibularhizoctonia sp. CBS 109695]
MSEVCRSWEVPKTIRIVYNRLCRTLNRHIQHRPSACSNSARSPVHIVTPDWIKHGASLVRGNMLWKEEYAPFEVDEGESRT